MRQAYSLVRAPSYSISSIRKYSENNHSSLSLQLTEESSQREKSMHISSNSENTIEALSNFVTRNINPRLVMCKDVGFFQKLI